MKRKLVLVPNNMGSRASRALAQALSQKVGHKVFRVLPNNVRNRIQFRLYKGMDKLSQLNLFKEYGVATVEYTTDRAVALDWLRDGCVFCRTLLRASEGRGIVIATTEQELVRAKLYTRYFKKRTEYRVHILARTVIDVQHKRKRRGVPDAARNTKIRNLANGYVFCREGLVEPPGLRELAARAVDALGYTMGAVDIAYNQHYERLAVLEVNANPGLQGTTLETYATAINNWYQEQAR